MIECSPASIQTGTVHFPRLRPEMQNVLLAARAFHDSFTGVTCFLSADGFRIRETRPALRNATTKNEGNNARAGSFCFVRQPSLR